MSSPVHDARAATKRLAAQEQVIESLSSIAGVAGASVGVVHGGDIIYTKHFGVKDVTGAPKADDDTLYGIGSCSKSFFAGVAAALVEQGKLSWTDAAKQTVPEFRTSSPVVTDEANLIDLAAHRLGLSGAFHLAFQGDGEHLIGTKHLWTYLPKLQPDFRGHFFEAAAGVYTSLADVLKYSKAVLDAASRLPAAAEGPLRQSDQLYTHHIPVQNPTFRERSYALGWIRTQLPGVVGIMGDNRRLLPIDQLPIIGQAASPRLALYHQGATVGYFPSFYLFPETQSAVIVLTNSIANCDAADWIAQALVQALFEDKNQDKVQEKRSESPPKRPLEAYTGDYYDDTGIFLIRIQTNPEKEDALQLQFQGKERQAYELRYFYGDTFEWTLTRDQTAKRARYHQFDQGYFNFHFQSSNGADIDALTWYHDPNIPNPEPFRKA